MKSNNLFKRRIWFKKWKIRRVVKSS